MGSSPGANKIPRTLGPTVGGMVPIDVVDSIRDASIVGTITLIEAVGPNRAAGP